MEVFVEPSKTDQFREGAWVPVARTHSKVCPVAMMEQYFRLGECTGDSNHFTSMAIIYRISPNQSMYT